MHQLWCSFASNPGSLLCLLFIFRQALPVKTERVRQKLIVSLPGRAGARGEFKSPEGDTMKEKSQTSIVDGAQCKVISGVHAGKSGTVRDIKTGKTGHISITVVQSSGERFKTLAKNVVVTKT